MLLNTVVDAITDSILVKNDSIDSVDIDAIIDWDKNGGGRNVTTATACS